ncbi:MAG: hypothetical protein OHK0023_06830 [Anaerolineae bacterium]
MRATQFTPPQLYRIEDIQNLVRAGFTAWKTLGDITVSRHPHYPYLLFAYCDTAAYKAEWSYLEIVSRGLILHAETGEIVARPFDKFFNWLEGGRLSHGYVVNITEKLDGSLGILYRTPDGYAITTRNDFMSVQSQWATDFLHQHHPLPELDESLTLLFEIIMPGNRIVVEYGDRAELVLLAARNRFTGDELPLFPDVYEMAARYGFRIPAVYTFNNLTEILAACGALDVNQEGYVVQFSDGQRFKFKGDRYLELQKLISGLSRKAVFRAVSIGEIDSLLRRIPEEFLGEVRNWQAEAEAAYRRWSARIEALYAEAPKETRKDFALWVSANTLPIEATLLFEKLDGKDLPPLIWRAIFETETFDG